MNKYNKTKLKYQPYKKTHNITPKSHYHFHWKKLKWLRHKNHDPYNKNNKIKSKEQLQKHKFPIQRRCS